MAVVASPMLLATLFSTVILATACRADSTTVGPGAPESPVDSTFVYPGEDAQAIVDAHPAGTAFVLKAGLHREFSVRAKPGNHFVGEVGTVLSGARLLTDFTRLGAYWVVGGQTQQNLADGPDVYGTEVCREDFQACIYPEDLYIDDEPLKQVATLGEVGIGAWFFDYGADMIYFVDDPVERKVEISVTWDAISAHRADGLTITGLTVEKYANAAGHGVVHIQQSDHVVIRDNEIRGGHGSGIAVMQGSNGLISDNYLHHNGRFGISSWQSDGLIIEGNELAYNNLAGYAGTWGEGGVKLATVTGATIRGNDIHDNFGSGIWIDIDARGVVIEHNRISRNETRGIFYEISMDGVIRNNTIEDNGARGGWYHQGGIVVSASANVEVQGNTLSGNSMGVIGTETARGSGIHGARLLENLYVHGNTITMSDGATGIVRNLAADDAVFSRNIRFENNTYFLGANRDYFRWRNAGLSEHEWKAIGQDVNSTFDRP